ncbi:MAG: VCBS repeat-containing protein [Candidatus Midichloria sp.]|nr:VCBS repeat-containing protein [Candidatus Midichloria sp.]
MYIANSNCGRNSVSVLLGKEDGTFHAAVLYIYSIRGSYTWGVTVADSNGDSKLDTVLIGNGGGTFKPATFYNVGSGPVGVDVRDFNNDGKIDIELMLIAI